MDVAERIESWLTEMKEMEARAMKQAQNLAQFKETHRHFSAVKQREVLAHCQRIL